MPRLKIGSKTVDFPDGTDVEEISAWMAAQKAEARRLYDFLVAFQKRPDPLIPIKEELGALRKSVMNKTDLMDPLSLVQKEIMNAISAIESKVNAIDVHVNLDPILEAIQSIQIPEFPKPVEKPRYTGMKIVRKSGLIERVELESE